MVSATTPGGTLCFNLITLLFVGVGGLGCVCVCVHVQTSYVWRWRPKDTCSHCSSFSHMGLSDWIWVAGLAGKQPYLTYWIVSSSWVFHVLCIKGTAQWIFLNLKQELHEQPSFRWCVLLLGRNTYIVYWYLYTWSWNCHGLVYRE